MHAFYFCEMVVVYWMFSNMRLEKFLLWLWDFELILY